MSDTADIRGIALARTNESHGCTACSACFTVCPNTGLTVYNVGATGYLDRKVKRFESPSHVFPKDKEGTQSAVELLDTIGGSVQPIKGLNTLNDHIDKYLEDNDIPANSGLCPAHQLRFFRFLGLTPEVQYLDERIFIIADSIWHKNIRYKIKDGIRGPPDLKRPINIHTFFLYVAV